MATLTSHHLSTIVRPMAEADTQAVLRLMETARYTHLRISMSSLSAKIKASPGFVAEDQVGLRGFMLTESHPPDTALIIAAAVRDTWSVPPYLDSLLPAIEPAVAARGCSTLTCIGYDAWLTEGLWAQDFETCEWIVYFERLGDWPKPVTAMPAMVRTAHLNDLPAIMALDQLAFNQLWRKSAGIFSEALAKAISFVVAELDGQIVGYEWCEIYRHHAHLARLAVHPNYQGRGIGAQLLYQAIIDTVSRGVNLITLNTQEDNHRSHALYKRFGFVQTEQRIPVLCKNVIRDT